MSENMMMRYNAADAFDGSDRVELGDAQWSKWERSPFAGQWLWKLDTEDDVLKKADALLQSWLEHSGLYPADPVYYENRSNLLWLRAQMAKAVTLYKGCEFADMMSADLDEAYEKGEYLAALQSAVNRYNREHKDKFAIIIPGDDAPEYSSTSVMIINAHKLIHDLKLLTPETIDERIQKGMQLKNVANFKDNQLWDDKPYGVKELLADKHLTGYRVSKETGLHTRTMGRLIKGDQPLDKMTVANADAVARAMGYENNVELRDDLDMRNRRYI